MTDRTDGRAEPPVTNQASAGGVVSHGLVHQVRELACKYAADSAEHRLLKSVVEILAGNLCTMEVQHREVRRLETALELQHRRIDLARFALTATE